MAWRAKCYECQQETEISRPFFETKDLFLAWTLLEKKILEKAVAHYEAHQRSAGDTRSCGGAGKIVPRANMLLAYPTTPDEDPTWGRQAPRRPPQTSN